MAFSKDNLEGTAIFDDIAPSIQAQYRGTNLEALIEALVVVRKKYVLGAYKSLVIDNLSLTTARGDALDMWGRLLGLWRFVLIDSVGGIKYEMSDDEFRTLLVCLAQKQFCTPNIKSVNDFVREVFSGYGDVEILDTNDMTYLIYTFNQALPSWLNYCFNNRDILPRPAGVGVKIEQNVFFFFGFNPDEYDETTDPAAYAARVAWFNSHINNFDTTIFGYTEAVAERAEWFKAHVGALDYTIYEDFEKGEYIIGFDPEPEDVIL